MPVQKTSHCYFTRCHETLTRTVFLETLWKLYLKKNCWQKCKFVGKKTVKASRTWKSLECVLTGYSKSKHFEDFARQHPLYLCLYVCTYVLILFYILNLSRWNRSSWIHVLKQCHSNFNMVIEVCTEARQPVCKWQFTLFSMLFDK